MADEPRVAVLIDADNVSPRLAPALIAETATHGVLGIKRMISGGDAYTEWNVVMATALLAMLPPAAVVLLMQRWFVKGLVDSEK